jgi:hypothetical protein
MTREPIYAAVFAFFSGLQANGLEFKAATRDSATWESFSPEEQPALLMRQKTEQAEYKKGFPTRWRLGIELMLYVHTGGNNDPDITPAQQINPLMDLIEDALAIDDQDNQTCTLGGLVSHCAISGVVEIHEGNLGDEAVVIVPIEILTF